MAMESINPATGERLLSYTPWKEAQLDQALTLTARATPGWQATPFAGRARLLKNAATELRGNAAHYARLITLEMGKLLKEARAEIEKCALGCDYYADHAQEFLQDEVIASDASKSYVAYLPLGTLLAVMPWNFPFWQVFRAAAPALMAGNTVVLKHASNVPQCALAIEEVFQKAGFPPGVFPDADDQRRTGGEAHRRQTHPRGDAHRQRGRRPQNRRRRGRGAQKDCARTWRFGRVRGVGRRRPR